MARVVVSTFGAGSTVMVNEVICPGHCTFPLTNNGVTVTVELIGEMVGLLATNSGMFPVPVEPKPTAALEFTQENVVPPIGPKIGTWAELTPSHRFRLASGNTDGSGFTIIWKVSFAPGQLTPLKVNKGEDRKSVV